MSLGFNSAIFPNRNRDPTIKHNIHLDCWPNQSIEPSDLLPNIQGNPSFLEINLNRIPIYQSPYYDQYVQRMEQNYIINGISDPQFLNFASYPSTRL